MGWKKLKMVSHSPQKHPLVSRRSLIQLAVLGVCLPAAHSANAEIALATAINRCARFRALSQRCVKAYAQVVLDVAPETAYKTLATAQRLIQTGFDELAQANYSTEITQHIAATRSEANKLTALIAATPKLEQLSALSAQADKFLNQANKAVELLTISAKSGNARIIDIAGRQRLLSQRMAKNHFLIAANVTSASARQQIEADKADFKTAMATLKKAPISTPGIRDDLELCSAQWVFFEAALDLPRTRTDALTNVASSSERLLEITNELVVKYEKALKDVLGTA
ncbi:MAG: type IV pili methyl-accepting chemotaxis transducer N-terminal domain-containing protein [Burkholderiaceae bacterium]|nr:type IV pili methyl-accepting chemotaxis transducer N-terminal domain-containing protein [Burkholderiaceae bacterium]